MMTFREFSALSKTLARIAWGTTPRALWKILYNFCWRNYRNMAEFERRQAEGKPFLLIFHRLLILFSQPLSFPPPRSLSLLYLYCISTFFTIY